jgi:hypothetical protein
LALGHAVGDEGEAVTALELEVSPGVQLIRHYSEDQARVERSPRLGLS